MLALALSVLLVLAGCGGGGGSSGGSSTAPDPIVTVPPVAPDPIVTVPPAEPDPKPIVMDQSPPPPPSRENAMPSTPPSITSPQTTAEVPDALIPNIGTGTKDSYYMPGGGYGDTLGSTKTIYSNGVTAFGKRVEGPFNNDPVIEVPNPPRDVRTAWHQGWTGTGANVMIIDGFSAPGRRDATHGYTVGMSALQIAPGATYYALDVGLNPFLVYIVWEAAFYTIVITTVCRATLVLMSSTLVLEQTRYIWT